MKKKICSILTVLVMVVGLIPLFQLDTVASANAIPGGGGELSGSYKSTSGELKMTAGKYTLTGDVTVENVVKIEGEVWLDMNNYKIIGNSENSSVFSLVKDKNSTLNIIGKGEIIQNHTSTTYGREVIIINQECTLNLMGNVKLTHQDNVNGRGVSNNGGTFNMYGGEITGNTAKNEHGGGVCIGTKGVFNLYGGIITNNKTDGGNYYGGGVDVGSGTFNMYGGVVKDNSAKQGDNIYGTSPAVSNWYSGTVIKGEYDSTLNNYNDDKKNLGIIGNVKDNHNNCYLSGNITTTNLTNNYYQLTGDVTLDDSWKTAKSTSSDPIVIDLNGHILNRNMSESGGMAGMCISVYSEDTLIIVDSAPNTIHEPGITLTVPNDSESLTVNGGVITGGYYKNTTGGGGGIYNQGTLRLYGGTICNNKVERDSNKGGYGGGVYNGNKLYMYGGLIAGNKALNTSAEGGGVLTGNDNSDEFIIYGGEISGNESAYYGGGVSVSRGKFIIKGGLIKDNKAAYYGGGIEVGSSNVGSGEASIDGGIITKNSSVNGGGGVYVAGDVTISGSPYICDNTTGESKDNVYLSSFNSDNDKIITITGKLTNTTPIGISTRQKPTSERPVTLTNSLGSYGNESNFTSDDPQYTISLDNGEAKLYTIPVVTYNITYNPGKGSGTMDASVVNANTEFTLPECTFDPPDQYKKFTGWKIGDSDTVVKAAQTYTFTEDTVLTAIYKTPDAGSAYEIYVKTPDKTYPIGVNQSVTIGALKSMIEDRSDIAMSKQTLTYNGKVLSDEKTLGYYNIQKEGTVKVSVEDQDPQPDPDPDPDPSPQPEPEPTPQPKPIPIPIPDPIPTPTPSTEPIVIDDIIIDVDEKNDIIIDISGKGEDIKSLELTKKAIEELTLALQDNDEIEGIIIKISDATIELDNKVLQAIAEQSQGESVTIAIDKTDIDKYNEDQIKALQKYDVISTYDVYVESNGVRLQDFNGGRLTVSVEFKPDANKDTNYYHIYRLTETGTLKRLVTRYKDSSLEFATDEIADIVIVYNDTVENMTREWTQYLPYGLIKNDDGSLSYADSKIGKGDFAIEGLYDGLVHRMYNRHTGEHIYTKSACEKGMLVDIGWSYEIESCYSAPPADKNTLPVYRVYNPNNQTHHYTVDESEVKMLVDKGWSFDNISFYVYAKDSKYGINTYRAYNPNDGQHNYTVSKAEHEYLLSLGWVDEQVSWRSI